MRMKPAVLSTLRTCLMALVVYLASMPAVYGQTLVSTSVDRNTLWRKVHTLCAIKAKEGLFPPSPCVTIHQGSDGYAIFKDQRGAYQYLLIPTSRIAGIESPQLLLAKSPNFLALAWSARRYVEAALGAAQPRDIMSMVINAPAGRSQDQLHIHIDCIREDVREAIAQWQPSITTQWAWLPSPLPPNGHRFMARRVDAATLSINPIKDLSAALPAGDSLAIHDLVVIGTSNTKTGDGFVLLSGRVDVSRGDLGNADDLQDTGCALATRR